MNHPKASIRTGTHKRHLSLWDFARVAAFQTFGMSVAILVTAAIQGNPYVRVTTIIDNGVTKIIDGPRH